MICNLTIGATVIELAGGNGRQSETSGLSLSQDTNFEQVAYIGVTDGRQFARPGSYVSVSFSSVNTFASVRAAETYILSLPALLADQSGATAQIGRETVVVTVTGTLSDGTNPVVFPPLYLAGSLNGFPFYSSDGLGPDDARTGLVYLCCMSGSPDWVLAKYPSNFPLSIPSAIWTSGDSSSATPNLVTTWAATSPATGAPTVAVADAINPTLTIYDAQASVTASHIGASVSLNATITGRTTAP